MKKATLFAGAALTALVATAETGWTLQGFLDSSFMLPHATNTLKGADLRRFARFAERVWGVGRSDDLAAMADEGIARYTTWLTSIGMPTTFAELGAKAEDIPRLAANLHLNGKTLGAFRPLTEADVRAILKLACRD